MAESISHCGAVQVRVKGAGILRPTLIGYDENRTQTLSTILMANNPGKSRKVLANMLDQRIQVELRTTGINEKFYIERVIYWMKPVYTEFPG